MISMLKLRPTAVVSVFVLAVFAVVTAGAVKKRVVQPPNYPAGRPYSAGMMVGDTLYVSGQIGADKDGKIPGNFEDEVHECLSNAQAILQAGGMDFPDVVSVQVYLTDMDMFQRFNAVYTQTFKEPRPTRTAVGVARLSGGAHLELTVTARK